MRYAIVNPSVDRDKQLEEVRDVYMHVEAETDASMVSPNNAWPSTISMAGPCRI